MKRNFSSMVTFMGRFFALALLVSFSITSSYGAISPNDAGKPVVPHSTGILTSGPLTTISHTFGNVPLPSNPGITTSTGTQSPRLFRSGDNYTCASPAPAFSTFSSGNFAYEAYTFVAKASECTTIDVTTFSSTNLFIGVYSDTFNPSNIIQNGVTNQGSSAVTTFSFNAIAGETYIIVVAEVIAGAGPGTDYTFTVDNVGGSAVPISIWWIVAAFVVVGGFTVYRFSLRRA